jgi:hypothetical protein
MSKVTALVYHRFLNRQGEAGSLLDGQLFPHGEKLETAVKAIASAWVEKGRCQKGF